jgi:hypothetical protein
MRLVLIVAASFLVILLSGLWLSRSKRPLNVVASTLHKLVGLGVAVLLVLAIRQVHRTAPLGPAQWLAVVVTGLLFAALAATGALLSGEKPQPVPIQKVHQIVPYLAVLSSASTLYLLLGR